MINEEYKAMLGGKSVIRELSEYATSRGAEIGYQNVFDYRLGNPSVPAPKSFTLQLHDYPQPFIASAVGRRAENGRIRVPSHTSCNPRFGKAPP